MSSAANNNAPTSAPTSTSKPSAVTSPSVSITESGQLDAEARNAKAAIGAAIHDFRTHLSNGADPRILTKKHPWMALGIAAAAGWVVGQITVPTKRRSIFEHLGSFKDFGKAADAKKPTGNGSTHRGLFDSLIHEVIEIAKPAVISAITGAFAGVKTADHETQQAAQGQGAAVPSGASADISSPS